MKGSPCDWRCGKHWTSTRFDRDTELTGNMKLKLWVSTSEGGDMGLFVGIKKLDVQGADLFEHPELVHGNSDEVNPGFHAIHTGSQHDSHLLIPAIP
jgi:hypothetical protein